MARLYLFRDEMEVYKPPPVCMRCGAPSSASWTKTFSWTPGGYFSWGWLAHLVHFILLVVETKRFRVDIPLCDRCFRRRRTYRWIVTAGLAGPLLLAGAGIALLAGDNHQAEARLDGWWLLGAAGLWAIIFMAVVGAYQLKSISTVEITKYWIALVKVSPAFVNAVDLQRRKYPPSLRREIAEALWGDPRAYEPGFEIAR